MHAIRRHLPRERRLAQSAQHFEAAALLDYGAIASGTPHELRLLKQERESVRHATVEEVPKLVGALPRKMILLSAYRADIGAALVTGTFITLDDLIFALRAKDKVFVCSNFFIPPEFF